jgi:hypothetical protein
MRLALLVIASALVICVSGTCMPAAAAPMSRVVVIRPAQASPTLREAHTRAEAELRAAGFEVVEIQSDDISPSRVELEHAARQSDAIAAISIWQTEGDAAADVWVVDQVTGKTVIRTVDVAGSAPAEIPSALAIRAVELLRASLIEVTVAAESPEERPADVPDDVEEFVAPDPRHPLEGLAFELAVVALVSFDEVSISAGPAARVSGMTASGLGARATWLGPSFGASVDGPEGEARVRQEALLFEGIWAPRLSLGPFTPSIAVGAGFYHLEAQGALEAPSVGQNDDVWAGCVSVGAGVGVSLTEDVMLRGELSGIVGAADLGIRMGGRRIGSVGRPTLAPSLGVVGRF